MALPASRPPLLLRPQYVVKPWGGRRMETDLGRDDLPDGPVGESWDVVDTGDVVSVVEGGPWDGRTLREVYGRPFPLLAKVLDAQADLSVQIHPDEAAPEAAKEEAWVALADGGHVAMGPAAPAEPEGDWLPRMARIPLCGGCTEGGPPPSLIHVPPGTVHAILGGSLVWEVQNPVDVTWRLDDYGRPDVDGRLRPLHRSEAAPVLARGPEGPSRVAEDGQALVGERIRLALRPPGRHAAAGWLVAWFGAGGQVASPAGDLTVPRGRTVVLPDGPVDVISDGWVALGGTPVPTGSGGA